MPISRERCDAWASPAPGSAADATLEAVRHALVARGSTLHGLPVPVCMHGSHRNGTSICAFDPVDIVVLAGGAVVHDSTGLPPDERAACARVIASDPARPEFDSEVQQSLRSVFGFSRGSVEAGNIAIRIAARGDRSVAHVVVATPYRRYVSFRSFLDHQYVDGILLRGRRDGFARVNYPALDSGETARKDAATRGAFTRAIRTMKRAREFLVAEGTLERGAAPSYFLESVLWNVPNARFVEDGQETAHNVLEWLARRPTWSLFACLHGQARLFGPSVAQWNEPAARRFVDTVVRLWNGLNAGRDPSRA